MSNKVGSCEGWGWIVRVQVIYFYATFRGSLYQSSKGGIVNNWIDNTWRAKNGERGTGCSRIALIVVWGQNTMVQDQ